MDKIVSIVIPSYNMEEYLPKCLASLEIDDVELLQELDIIVVNDGSKDKTSEIAHNYGHSLAIKMSNVKKTTTQYKCSNGTMAVLTDYGIIRVIDKPNHHYGSCINAALPIAKGTFIKVLDADDSFDTNVFKDYVGFLKTLTDSKVDLIVSAFSIVDENGMISEERYYDLPEYEFDIELLSSLKKDFIMHAVTYRTERVRNSGYVQTEGCIYTDSEWMFAPMLTVRKARYLNKLLYKYLVGRTGQSVSLSNSIKNSAVQLRIMRNLINKYREVVNEVTEGQRKYLELELSRIYYYTIDGYFHNKNSSLLKDEFVPVDEELRELCPAARKRGGEKYVLFASLKHPFHYVNAWQESKIFRWRYPLFAKWYIKIRAMF